MILGNRAASRERELIIRLLEHVKDKASPIFTLSQAKELMANHLSCFVEVSFFDLKFEGVIEVNPAHRACAAPYYRCTDKVLQFNLPDKD